MGEICMSLKVSSAYIDRAGRNLTGKTVVITGATSGIGLATAKIMASYGAFVIGVGRSEQRCQLAETEIRELHADAKIAYVTADLSLLREVRRLSEKIKEIVHKEGKDCIDVLVNNAGTFTSWYISTEEGFEMQFAVNYLAPFLLTHELLPFLKASPLGRIINLSSGSHYRTKIHWNDIMMRKHYNCLIAYKQTKLANVLFTAELNRRLSKGSDNYANIYKSNYYKRTNNESNGNQNNNDGKQSNNARINNNTSVNSNVMAFAVDPGLVNTQIGFKGTTGIVKWIWKKRSQKGIEPVEAAFAIVFLAGDSDVMNSKKIYWKNCLPVKPSKYSQREDVALRLWELTEQMCGINRKTEG